MADEYSLINVRSPRRSWDFEVNHNGAIEIISLFNQLLSPNTQDGYAEHRISAIKSPNEGYIESAPFYYSFFKLLKDKADYPKHRIAIEEVVLFLRESLENNCLATLSRVVNRMHGLDSVVHNHRMQNQYSIDANIVGPDELVKLSETSDRYNAILGSDNVHEINEVSNFITGKDLYAWFINTKPKREDIETVVRFDSGSGRANLDCNWNLNYSGVGLPVRKIFKPAIKEN